MKELKFVQTGGPYGDATCDYNVLFTGPLTLRYFLEVIGTRNEWGRVDYCTEPPPGNLLDGRTVLKYKHNQVTYRNEDLWNKIADKEIRCIYANGGYTAMDYRIWLEDDFK